MLTTLSLIFCLADGTACIEHQLPVDFSACLLPSTAQSTAIELQKRDPSLKNRVLARWSCTIGGQHESI